MLAELIYAHTRDDPPQYATYKPSNCKTEDQYNNSESDFWREIGRQSYQFTGHALCNSYPKV